MTPAERDMRDQFLYWWPVIARLAGLGIAAFEMARGVSDPSLLAFAGGLIVVPNVFDQQRRRNTRRLDTEEDQ